MPAALLLLLVWHQPENYLHVSGQFWTSEDLEEAADAQQQEAHKQLLADMASELKAQVCRLFSRVLTCRRGGQLQPGCYAH